MSRRIQYFACFFIFPTTQLNAVHVQLMKKIETGNFGVLLWEIRCFLRNRLLEFYEIWEENTLAKR